nr:MAG TPA: hypothetical protein [Bacteriophage sp.]
MCKKLLVLFIQFCVLRVYYVIELIQTKKNKKSFESQLVCCFFRFINFLNHLIYLKKLL